MNPNKVVIALVLVSSLPVLAFAKDPDPRLATVKTAFVMADDPLTSDKPISTCLAAHLSDLSPLAVVESKEAADVVLVVMKSSLAGGTMRNAFGSIGFGRIEARLPNGTVLWNGYQNLSNRNPREPQSAQDAPCLVADALITDLRNTMRKARGKQ